VSERLILFAKRPRLGEVKTRLVPPLSPAQALALYEAFLEDQLRFLLSLAGPGRAVELSTDEPWRPEGAPGIAVTEQGPGDLGDRLHRAFLRSRATGAERTAVIGADSPTLPARRVEQAFRQLSGGASAVLTPATDGGYVLIAMTEPAHALFVDVPWGGPRVTATTRARAAAAGIALAEIEPWYDVDDADGLARLRLELSTTAGRRRAPATAAALAALGDPEDARGAG
jgi:rSAM/selenodomain-associated transferase 1